MEKKHAAVGCLIILWEYQLKEQICHQTANNFLTAHNYVYFDQSVFQNKMNIIISKFQI